MTYTYLWTVTFDLTGTLIRAGFTIPIRSKLWYICYVTASDTGDRKEVNYMEILVSLFVAIMGNVIGNLICHYLVKWLDSDQ